MNERIYTLYVDNPNGFRIKNLFRDSLTNPGPLPTATVEVRVQDLLGTDVPLTQTTWPLVLPYVQGSTGDYEAFLQTGDMVLTERANYHIVFSFNDQSIGQSGPVRYLAVARKLYR